MGNLRKYNHRTWMGTPALQILTLPATPLYLPLPWCPYAQQTVPGNHISFWTQVPSIPASPFPKQVRSQLNAYLRVLLGPWEAREGTMARWDSHGGLRGPQGSEAWSGSPAGGRLLASCTSAATAAET